MQQTSLPRLLAGRMLGHFCMYVCVYVCMYVHSRLCGLQQNGLALCFCSSRCNILFHVRDCIECCSGALP